MHRAESTPGNRSIVTVSTGDGSIVSLFGLFLISVSASRESFRGTSPGFGYGVARKIHSSFPSSSLRPHSSFLFVVVVVVNTV